MTEQYVHGYSPEEANRLMKQADVLKPYLEGKMHFSAGSKVLEAGCGVGAQSVILAKLNPGCEFTCVDISSSSLARAKQLANEREMANVKYVEADIHDLPFHKNVFDYCFFCFVLEHFKEPEKMLQQVSKVIKPEGSIRAIECDLGAAEFSPFTPDIKAIVDGAISLSTQSEGNACMGRLLEETMKKAKLRDVKAKKIAIDTRDTTNGIHALMVLKEIVIPVYKGMKNNMISKCLIESLQYDNGIKQLESIVENHNKYFIDAIYIAEGKPYKP